MNSSDAQAELAESMLSRAKKNVLTLSPKSGSNSSTIVES